MKESLTVSDLLLIHVIQLYRILIWFNYIRIINKRNAFNSFKHKQ